MKKFVYLLLLLFPMVSCVSRQSADQVEDQKDSLARVVAAKDSMINEIFESMSAVAENLNAIKEREHIINKSIDNGEIQNQTPAQINEDVEAINQLLLDNREKMARLQQSANQLRKANLKVASLEKMLAQLQKDVETKDQEITVLKSNLEQMHIQVAELNEQVEGLNTQVSGLTETNASLQGEVKGQTDILNTAYYIVGSERELLDKEIVYKSGFIGRTLKINESRSLDSFTKIDIRNFDSVLIGQKKVTLVSSHPAESYEFVQDDKGIYESLIIKDKKKFWEYSKVLVISYK